MRYRPLCAGVAIWVLGLCSHADAQLEAAVATFAAGEAVGQVVEDVRSGLLDIVAETEGATNRTMMEGRTHAIVMMQNAEYLGTRFANKTFGQLTDQQQRFFANLKAAIDHWNTGNTSALLQLSTVAADFESALATIPGSNTIPRVLGYGPSYLVQGGEPKYKIEVTGSFLGFGSPSLEMGGAPCERIAKVEKKLTFYCPTTNASTTDSVRVATGRLVVFNGQSFWERIGSLFSDNSRSYVYDIALTLIPRTLGQYHAEAFVEVEEAARRTVSRAFYERNEHCSGARPVNWTVNADTANGWSIDPLSIRPRVTTRSTNSQFNGIVNLTSSGFALRGRVANNGSCRRVFGEYAYRDARGALGVTVEYDEVKTTAALKSQSVGSGTIEWGKDVSIAFPQDTQRYLIKIVQADDQVSVTTEPGDHGWVTLSYDSVSHIGVIRPRTPDAAFAD